MDWDDQLEEVVEEEGSSKAAVAAAAAAAFREILGRQDGRTDEEEEEYLKKIELLVKQRLHELEEERRRRPPQPHSTATTTTDDHTGSSTSNGRWNEGGHSGGGGGGGGGGFIRKQVPADNKIQVEEEEEENKLQLRAFVCFPEFVLLPRRRIYGNIVDNLPEMLVFSNVVDDLDTLCIEAEKSFLFEEVVKSRSYQVTSGFTHVRTVLRNVSTERPREVIEWLKVLTNVAMTTKIVINDLIVKKAPKINTKARRVAIEELKSIHDKMVEEYDFSRLMHFTRSWSHREIWAHPTSSLAHQDFVGREEDTEMIRKHFMSKEKRVLVISVGACLVLVKLHWHIKSIANTML